MSSSSNTVPTRYVTSLFSLLCPSHGNSGVESFLTCFPVISSGVSHYRREAQGSWSAHRSIHLCGGNTWCELTVDEPRNYLFQSIKNRLRSIMKIIFLLSFTICRMELQHPRHLNMLPVRLELRRQRKWEWSTCSGTKCPSLVVCPLRLGPHVQGYFEKCIFSRL